MNDQLADLEAMFDDLCTDHQEAEADFWDGSVDDEGECPSFTRFAAEWLRANRDRVLEALGGEAIGWAHDCCGGQVRSEQPGICGYPWCGDALGSGPVWLFPLGEDQ